MFDQAKWQKMSLAEQMGNIGSEVSKAFYWREKDKRIARGTVDNVLELIDLTLEDPKSPKKLKELCRLREVFCDCFFELGNFQVSEKAIKEYFLPFALMANKQC